jgi:hypothetical protein
MQRARQLYRANSAHIIFVTGTPTSVREGSGTYVGFCALRDALLASGVDVMLIAPGEQQLSAINTSTAQLQNQMWSVVQTAATSKPSPTTSLAASGMNDVLNSQGYTQAAWLNRIPTEAWVLMIAIAICSNFLVGYGARQTGTGLLIVLPFVLAIAFFLVSDIDSPRRGGSRVGPQNLDNLSRSLQKNK